MQQLRPYQTDQRAKRLTRQIKPRATRFADLAPTAGEQVASSYDGPETVYVVGPRPTNWRAWALDDLPHAVTPAPSYEEGAYPIWRYDIDTGPDTVRRVELHHAAEWYGPGTYTARDARDAWDLTAAALATAFADRRTGPPTMLATPATTGRELFLRTIPHGVEYPALDDDTQTLLRSTLGQARIEGPDALLRDHAGAELPALYEYDGRLMYAALCWGLPTGVPTFDNRDEFAAYAAGRYEVRATVPRDWPLNFGLLGVKREGSRERWEYPAEPGRTFTTWADGAELLVCARAGWEFDILHRLIFPRPTSRPLDAWARKLIAAYRACDPADVAGKLAQRAIRQIILTTIGAFQGRPQTVTRTAKLADVQAGTVRAPVDRLRIEGDVAVWGEQTAPKWPGLAHPEWCAAVWGRARARLMQAPQGHGALNARGTVVAFRTDAVYTTEREGWHDDGNPGRFRLVAGTDRPLPTPRNQTDLLAVRRRHLKAMTA